MASVPPPSSPPPGLGHARPAPASARRREIVLDLEAPRKRLGRGRAGQLRLAGAELTVMDPDAMSAPLCLAGGQVSVASVDRGATAPGGDDARFPILRRLDSSRVVPREHGIEGWLWTSRQGSGLPSLAQGEAPNLALVFVKPLDADTVRAHFKPAWVKALAERSPLGEPSVGGLLLAVASTWAAEDAFRLFGVLHPLTDREVPPALRRHLPGDQPANPTVGRGDDVRVGTSIAPPGSR